MLFRIGNSWSLSTAGSYRTPSALPQGRAPERAVSGVFLLFCPEVSGDRSEKYGKPVVVIIAATAQSHTEYCVQCMQVDPGVTVIGTQSAGTNGNVSEFVLPGGIRSCFSGLDWHYPGGWCVQRLEVRLDLEVEPTIGGVRAGRVETREAAVDCFDGASRGAEKNGAIRRPGR